MTVSWPDSLVGVLEGQRVPIWVLRWSLGCDPKTLVSLVSDPDQLGEPGSWEVRRLVISNLI